MHANMPARRASSMIKRKYSTHSLYRYHPVAMTVKYGHLHVIIYQVPQYQGLCNQVLGDIQRTLAKVMGSIPLSTLDVTA